MCVYKQSWGTKIPDFQDGDFGVMSNFGKSWNQNLQFLSIQIKDENRDSFVGLGIVGCYN